MPVLELEDGSNHIILGTEDGQALVSLDLESMDDEQFLRDYASESNIYLDVLALSLSYDIASRLQWHDIQQSGLAGVFELDDQGLGEVDGENCDAEELPWLFSERKAGYIKNTCWRDFHGKLLYENERDHDEDFAILMLNVMVVFTRDGISRRVALGEAFLKPWVKAKPEFNTFVLE